MSVQVGFSIPSLDVSSSGLKPRPLGAADEPHWPMTSRVKMCIRDRVRIG